jgi:hypothetical protein
VHRKDPANHKSRKAPKKTVEVKAKRQTIEQEAKTKAQLNNNKHNDAKQTPEVDEDKETFRMRKGRKRQSRHQRNYKLKPMRTLAPQIRCDPARLEAKRE